MSDRNFALLVAIFALGGFGGLMIREALTARTERACLRAGYPSAEWRIIGPSYCIKRVNQTDVVVPLDSVRR